MLINHDINELNIEKGTALTIGKFDGLHLGHRELLEAVISKKEEGLLSTVLMLTSDHPEARYLLTEKETEEMLSEAGIDLYVRLPLTKERMSKEAEDFVREILVEKLHVKELFCGSDFRFGKERKGDAALLQKLSEKYGFTLTVLEKVQSGEEEVSSTRIRELLRHGRMEEVNRLLGYEFTVSGEIIHGRQIGRSIGFPTINILPQKEKLLPCNGVYYAAVSVSGKTYGAVLNLGTKPTVTDEKITLLEAHLLDFSGDLYGKDAEVRFRHFIRSERKFEGLTELKAQIAEDLREARLIYVCEQSVNNKKKY